MKLIIAEKPSQAKDIAAVVGAAKNHNGYKEGCGYLVSWCVGHLVRLAEPEYYDPAFRDWTIEALPIAPDPMQYLIKESDARERRRSIGQIRYIRYVGSHWADTRRRKEG